MTRDEINALLLRTFEDRKLSRNERQALDAAFDETTDAEFPRRVLSGAFEVVRGSLAGVEGREVLDWLEDVLRRVVRPAAVPQTHVEAHFSPGEDCLRTIRSLIARAKFSADVCVFTITDDRISEALLQAHHRGVVVRVVTDDSKAEDVGSDVVRLAASGIAVRVDRSPFHMHHKFAVMDQSILLTGSYNWTRGAAANNAENLIVTDDARLVTRFLATFEDLWTRMA